MSVLVFLPVEERPLDEVRQSVLLAGHGVLEVVAGVGLVQGEGERLEPGLRGQRLQPHVEHPGLVVGQARARGGLHPHPAHLVWGRGSVLTINPNICNISPVRMSSGKSRGSLVLISFILDS